MFLKFLVLFNDFSCTDLNNFSNIEIQEPKTFQETINELSSEINALTNQKLSDISPDEYLTSFNTNARESNFRSINDCIISVGSFNLSKLYSKDKEDLETSFKANIQMLIRFKNQIDSIIKDTNDAKYMEAMVYSQEFINRTILNMTGIINFAVKPKKIPSSSYSSRDIYIGVFIAILVLIGVLGQILICKSMVSNK